jgi:magnesium chelatase subunit I
MASARPSTLGELQAAVAAGRVRRRPVRDEVRENLVARLRAGETLFPGIIGYDDTVVPQIVNAVLSRHNFILLGLRGQAKSRILRGAHGLLDEALPVVPGCEIHDDPLAPLCAACRARVRTEGDACRSRGSRATRYVEKLATPDRHDRRHDRRLDPIKAARADSTLPTS